MTSRRGVRRLLLAGGLGLLVVPELIWIGLDRSAWGWDQAAYGSMSIGLWATLSLHPHEWAHALMTTLAFKAPGTGWIGQFFVPLHSIFGYERAMMLSVVACQAGSIAMVFAAARRLGASLTASAAGALALAGAPLFIVLGRGYWVEPLQTFCVAWVLFIMASAPRWPRSLILTQLAAAVALGLLAKVSTPSFMAAPAAVAFWFAIRPRTHPSDAGPFWRDRRVIASGTIAFVLIIGALAWYARNLDHAIHHARDAATSSRYGHAGTFGTKSIDWLHRLAESTFIPYIGPLLLVLLTVSLWIGRRRGKLNLAGLRDNLKGRRAEVLASYAACAVTVIVALALLSLQTTDVVRFIAPLTACVALLLGGLVAGLTSMTRSRLVGAGAIALLAFQFVFASFEDESRAQASDWFVWLRAPVRNAPPHSIDLHRLARLTCTAEANNRQSAVVPGINLRALEMYAREDYALGGRLCSYDWPRSQAALGAERAWRKLMRIAPPYLIAVDYGNPSNPEPPLPSALPPHDRAVGGQILRLALHSREWSVLPGSRRNGVVVLRRAAASPRPAARRRPRLCTRRTRPASRCRPHRSSPRRAARP